MKIILIENCGDCPYGSPHVADSNSYVMRCKIRGCRIVGEIEDNPPIPDWCPLEDAPGVEARENDAMDIVMQHSKCIHGAYAWQACPHCRRASRLEAVAKEALVMALENLEKGA